MNLLQIAKMRVLQKTRSCRILKFVPEESERERERERKGERQRKKEREKERERENDKVYKTAPLGATTIQWFLRFEPARLLAIKVEAFHTKSFCIFLS